MENQMSAKILNVPNPVPVFACCLLLQGCAALDTLSGTGSDLVSYELTSTPSGATVFVNGESKGTTPLSLTLEAKKRWVGILVAQGGWRYENNFYFIEAVPSASDRERYLSDSTYINARNVDQSNRVHFDLALRASGTREQQEGMGKIVGLRESFLPTFKSTGYARMLQINGQPLEKWNADPYAVELPVGNYSIAALCEWYLGIGGEAKIANMWPLKLKIERGKTYQLETKLLPGNRCQVFANVLDLTGQGDK